MPNKAARLVTLALLAFVEACSQIPFSAEDAPIERAAPIAASAQGGATTPQELAALEPAPPPISAPAPEPAPMVPVPKLETRVIVAEFVTPPASTGEALAADKTDVVRPADDLWDRIRRGFAMPDLEGTAVRQRERWYAGQEEYLARMVERSKLYLFYIVEEVEKRGLPTEIALLPMVESAFNPMAYSRSHASGLWQFIPSTGKNYKLNQNWWADARRDIIASTDAALDYLQFLYDLHQDWHLALASYNFGENGVLRAIQRNKARGLPTDYQSLRVPRETRGYVPKLQALKNIIANPDAFGIRLEPIPNEPYFATVPAERDMDILIAAKLAEMSADELIALNPALNRPVISGPHTQFLVLPADRVDTFRRNLEAYDQPLTSWQPYTMKRGDTLARLAASHGISLAKLRLANGIHSRTRIGPGAQLLLPIKGSGAAAEPLPAVFQRPVEPIRHGGAIYVVQKGDTLWGIARRYGVSTENLRQWNHIGVLTTGQRLRIYKRGAGKFG